MSEFLSMGGYGAYVWPCFGVSLVVLGALYVQSARQLKRLREQDQSE